MIVKFITMKGASNIAATPFYVGFVQHDRTMSRRETYEYCAERTGFKAAAIRAVFMALAEFIRENQRKGNITYLDGIASIRNYVKGSFAGLSGPWVKGVNYLSVQAVEMEPFKTLLAAILPVNNSEGAKPVINTVLDETTLVYDVITGTDVFSIAGSDLAPDATSTSPTSRTSRRTSRAACSPASTRSRSTRAAASATSSACGPRPGGSLLSKSPLRGFKWLNRALRAL